MRRIGAWFGLAFLGVVVPVALAMAAFAPGVAEAAGCRPAIASITTEANHYLGKGFVDIRGTCFGTASRFIGEDRSYLRISDTGTGDSVANNRWNACWTGDPGTDSITCDVDEWTDTHVRFIGFAGGYGAPGWSVAANDNVAFQIWNAQTGAGPAVAFIRRGIAAPTSSNPDLSSIARALASPRDAFSSVSADIVNATIAVGAALFVTFPANLFNQTFEENYADISAWWRRKVRWLRDPAADDAGKAHGKPERNVRPGSFAAVVLGGALLGGLLDPGFGFNLRSALTVVALALAICVGIGIPVVVAQSFHRLRHLSVRMQVRALPAGLAIAAACVLVSRVSGFRPGYLYGIVAGVVLGRSLSKRERGHLIVLTTLTVIAVSVLAWIAWAGINGSAQKADANDGLVLVDVALAATFVAGLVGSVIGMLPLRFLPGHALKSWNVRVWATVFGVSLFGLIQVMLRPHATSQGPSHAPLVTTLVLFVAFGVGTVQFRWHFIRKQLRAAGEPGLSWQQALVRIAGEAKNGPVQLAATADGVSFIDVTEPVVDLTQTEIAVPAQRTPRTPPVQTSKAKARKTTAPRAGAKSR